LALSARGFNVPETIAAGELQRWRFVERAFVLTAKVDGQPLPMFLTCLAKVEDRKRALQLKRAGVERLAELIRRFHLQGFVHGDMLASNLLISQDAAGEPTVYFMDNDRTRRYPSWFRHFETQSDSIEPHAVAGYNATRPHAFFASLFGAE
jgi:hypothetical protein